MNTDRKTSEIPTGRITDTHADASPGALGHARPESVGLPAVVAVPSLPVVPVPVPPGRGRRRWRRRTLLMLVLLGAVIGSGTYWWRLSHPGLPVGIVSGNGRLEADEIDIDTKFPGRIASLLVDEGDMVKAGQVLAVMDTQDLAASLKKMEAVELQTQRALDEAVAAFTQQKSQVLFAHQQLDRARVLTARGFETHETLDQRQQQVDAATAGLNVAVARIGEAEHAHEAAQHDVELYKVNIADNTLVAARDGRIQYRVANVGEVLAAGGKVFTMLDTGYVYMDVYLPTTEAGRIRIGSDARIVLDAYPQHPIPAAVVFIASQAQFTPKTVETKDERDKLMFRIRVRIDPERLRTRAAAVRSGLPGVTYLRTDPAVAWPPQLQVTTS